MKIILGLSNKIHKLYYSSIRTACSNSVQLKPPWKVLFFGSDEFSLSSLKSLYKEYRAGAILNKLEVVTSFKNKKNPVYEFATKQNTATHDWPVNVPDNGFHVGIVVSFGHLIPENIIKKFPLGMINIHASLLPRWRGAAPIFYALANGDKETGITIMTVKPHKFDVGEIVDQKRVEIPPDMKMPELHSKLASLGAELLLKAVRELPENLKNARKQPDEGVTLAPRVKPSFACVRWNEMSATDVYNLGRAVEGYLPLTSMWNNVQVKLQSVNLSEVSCSVNTDFSDKRPGYVVYDKAEKLVKVLCVDGKWISVKSVGVKGKRTMSAADFNNGYIKKEHIQNRYFK